MYISDALKDMLRDTLNESDYCFVLAELHEAYDYGYKDGYSVGYGDGYDKRLEEY